MKVRTPNGTIIEIPDDFFEVQPPKLIKRVRVYKSRVSGIGYPLPYPEFLQKVREEREELKKSRVGKRPFYKEQFYKP